MVCPLSRQDRKSLSYKWFGLFLLALSTISAVGCKETQDPIRAYRVKKAPLKRTLAAMVAHGDKIWVFKVSGSDRYVSEFEGEFLDFLQSISFDDQPEARHRNLGGGREVVVIGRPRAGT